MLENAFTPCLCRTAINCASRLPPRRARRLALPARPGTSRRGLPVPLPRIRVCRAGWRGRAGWHGRRGGSAHREGPRTPDTAGDTTPVGLCSRPAGRPPGPPQVFALGWRAASGSAKRRVWTIARRVVIPARPTHTAPRRNRARTIARARGVRGPSPPGIRGPSRPAGAAGRPPRPSGYGNDACGSDPLWASRDRGDSGGADG